jgi:hemerythrin-like domain-containing protein
VFQRFKPGVEPRGSRMAKGDFAPSFELTMARKDLRLGLEAAERSGLPLAVLPALAKRMDEVIAAGHGAEDYGVIAAEAVAAPAAAVRLGGNAEGDPIAQLESSHRKLEERMAELARTPGDDQAREDFLGFVERSVRRHEEDEEESLFPRLAHVAELRAAIASLRDEHHAHVALHRALRDAKDDAGAAEALELLRRAYAKHVQLEESVLFPGARLALDRATLAEVMREMQARRGRGPGGGGGGGGRRNR